ncbi:MAG: iron transporter permease [Marmoricola sp.]|nr:iron transporter permease [Marmoricola sp.]
MVVLLAGASLSLLVGSRAVSPVDVWSALTSYDASDPMQAVVSARIPRTVVGLVAGAALGLAGASMQGLTRNPLADPGILGINAGASLGMVLAISVFGVTALSGYIWFALLGAALATVLVHAIASLGRDGATPVKLTVAGAALTAGLSSWISTVLLTDKETMDVFRYWAVGTVGGRTLDTVWPLLPFFAVGALLALSGSRVLNLMALGDDLARGLGSRADLDRIMLGTGIVLLCGAATALAGPIAFVGLVVPHLARIFVGADYSRILPWSMALGAVLVVVADVVGRVVLPPTEVQVGIMTAVVGVPVFLVLVRRGRMGSL